MSMDTLASRSRAAWWIGVTCIPVLWIMFIVVDQLVPVELLGMPFWQIMFNEGGPVEHLQWLTLSLAAVISIAGAALLEASDRQRASFFRWMGAALLLMLIEDAGNSSHFVRGVITTLQPEIPSTVGRLPVFVVIGLVALVAGFKGWRLFTGAPGFRGALLAGYVSYATAALMLIPLQVLSLYARVGEAIMSSGPGEWIRPMREPAWGAEVDNTGKVFLDLAVEESLELLGAAFLLTAVAMAYRRAVGEARDPARTAPPG